MVQRVTDRAGRGGLSRKVRAEIDAILATVTGPQRTFVTQVGSDIVFAFVWNIRNTGQSPGNAGLRLNLGLDGFFGDSSQFILEADGVSVAGALANAATVQTTYPTLIQPGTTRSLSMTVFIDSGVMFDAQGNITGFNWWIAEVTARDLDKDELAQGDSRFEVRDWFRLEPSALTPAVIEVVGNPGFSVNLL